MSEATTVAVQTMSAERVAFTLYVAEVCDHMTQIALGQSLKPFIESHFKGWVREQLYELCHAIQLQAYAALKAEPGYTSSCVLLFDSVPLDEKVQQSILDLHEATILKLAPGVVERTVTDFLAALPTSKVYTKSVYQMTPEGTELVEEESYKYKGPVAQCLRAEEAMAKDAANTAKTTAGTLGQNAAGELGQLNPFFSREMHAEHGFDPTQTNEMLTAAGAGTGAATGAADAAMARTAATTGNASAATKSQQELARDKMKADAGVSEGIAAQDVLGAKTLNQEGAAGMQGLYGENLKGQLSAMGQEAGDINAATEASKTGWVQNATAAGKVVATAL